MPVRSTSGEGVIVGALVDVGVFLAVEVGSRVAVGGGAVVAVALGVAVAVWVTVAVGDALGFFVTSSAASVGCDAFSSATPLADRQLPNSATMATKARTRKDRFCALMMV